MYQVLARKWRPKSFAEVVGQEHVLRALINALTQNRLHHAYIFAGTRGVGKTTLARIVAKCLNCEKGITATPCGICTTCIAIDEGNCMDLIEVDAASRTKVEDTRDLLENVQYSPISARFKIYIIDEVHMLSLHSFNALLKTLEEPPAHVKFLLATTDPQRLPITVLSRCLQFNLKTLSQENMQKRLAFILEQEQIPYEENALASLAIAANGSMRDALSLLDQAIAYGHGKIVVNEIDTMLGTVKQAYIFDLLAALSQKNAVKILAVIEEMLSFAVDFAAALDVLLTVLHQITLVQNIPELPPSSPEINDLAKLFTKEEIQLHYQIALIGKRDLALAPTPKIGFEMVLLRMLAFRPEETLPLKPTVQVTQPKLELNANNLLAQLQVSGTTQALIQHCTIKSIQDSHVILILDSSQAPLLNQKHTERIAQAISELYKKPMTVEIILGNSFGAKPKPSNDLARAMEQDPKVQSILETFNATLIPESVKDIK